MELVDEIAHHDTASRWKSKSWNLYIQIQKIQLPPKLHTFQEFCICMQAGRSRVVKKIYQRWRNWCIIKSVHAISNNYSLQLNKSRLQIILLPNCTGLNKTWHALSTDQLMVTTQRAEMEQFHNAGD
jgi:hypothetical protein